MALETAIVVGIIVCATALVAYITKLLFMSKCTKFDFFGVHVRRDVSQESQQVSSMHLPTIH